MYHPNTFEITESNTKINSLLDFGIDTDFYDPDFDYIFHFAAVTKAGDWCLSHQGEQWLDNQRLNTNVLQFWKEYCPDAEFIAIGTSCSYGNHPYKTEKDYLTHLPESSLLTYAYTKRMLYLGLDALHKQYGMNYMYFIPPTLYGSEFTEKDNHFIYDIIRKVSKAKETGSDIEMWGNGSQRREIVWVNDFISIMCNFAFEDNRKFYNTALNIGSGKEYTMKAYYEKVCKLFEYDASKIKPNEEKYVGMLSNVLTITDPTVSAFKYKPINKGLEELVKYYKSIQ